MTRPLALALCGAALLLLLLPTAASQSVGLRNPPGPTPTTLYMHLIDFQDFPINTQLPDDNFTQSTIVAPTTSTTSCLPEDTPGVVVNQAYHTFYGYSSPSYVEYDHIINGLPRIHAERGISYDAVLAEGLPFTLYWYMSTQSVAAGANGVDPDLVPIPVPNVVVTATIRAGDDISVDDRAYNTGTVLVRGENEPTLLLGPKAIGPGGTDSTVVTPLGEAGGKWLYEFAIPMTIEENTIPRAVGYNLRIDVRMDTPQCAPPDKTLMPNVVRIHSAPDQRPRMEFSVLEPIRLEYIHPQFVGDDLVIHTSMNSVWGNYDVSEVSSYTPQVQAEWMQVGIDGPSPATGLVRAALVQRTEVHYHHQEAVDVTYVWPHRAEGALPGVYKVNVYFRNDQGLAEASGTVTFEIGKDGRAGAIEKCGAVVESSQDATTGCGAEVKPKTEGGQQAPGVGPLALIATLAAAAGVAARRR